MGFSLTGAHVIFFIAVVIAAGTVSGVFLAITTNLSSSLSDRGDRLQEQLDTDFEIISDPDNIPLGASDYIFYVKNIGGNKLITTNETFQVFIDGEIAAIANYNFTDSSIQPSDYTSLYVDKTEITIGTHTMRLVGPMAIEDEFSFTV